MLRADDIQGRQSAVSVEDPKQAGARESMRTFWKCAAGSISIDDVIWIPLFAALLLLSMQLSLTLHGYNAMWDWARETDQSMLSTSGHSVPDPVIWSDQSVRDAGERLAPHGR